MATEVLSVAALPDGGSTSTDAISAAALPDDGLAKVLGVLPPRSLAVARCVCKAWRDVIDARALLRPHLLPHSVRGVLINYIDHHRPHLFARPASSPATFPKVDGLLSFMPNANGLPRFASNERDGDWWKVLHHCNGLLLCDIKRESRLLVCNPATQSWTLLPSGHPNVRFCCAYMAFDPMVSPQYDVFLIPHAPEKTAPVHQKAAEQAPDAPSNLQRLFSLPGALSIDEDDLMVKWEDDSSVDEDDQTDNGQEGALSTDEDDQTDKGQPHDDHPCRLTEWPPSPWSLKVFSSSTGVWEDRLFVREGKPIGTVEGMGLDLWESTVRGPRQRYAVYKNRGLYVHCRGSFMARFSLSTNKYQVIKIPIPTESLRLKPYLGTIKNALYFGIVDDERQLRLWMLNESCGHMEWLLKYEVDMGLYAGHIASLPYNDGRKQDGSWVVKEAKDYVSDDDSNVEAQSEEASEWDSDEDDICIVEAGDEYHHMGWFDILGFHPYKEVVFLAATFGVASYHLTNPNKIQYLGNSRPRCYYRNYTNDIYESFIYTPCMIGDLLHGDDTGDTSFIDEH